MSIKPLFDCLLCCDESMVMKKISHETLNKYTDFQYKPFIPHLVPVSELEIVPLIQEELYPIPKVKHWSYLKRQVLLEKQENEQEVERSMIRREMAGAEISFDEEEHDIYAAQYSSEEDLELNQSSEDPKQQKSKKQKKKKKKSKQKTNLQNFVKSLGKTR